MAYASLVLSSSIPGLGDQSPSSFAAAAAAAAASRPSSSHSAYSRPASSHGGLSLAPHLHIPMNDAQQNIQNNIYNNNNNNNNNNHPNNYLQRPTLFPPHSRQSSSATSYSLPSTGLISPADSPPSASSLKPNAIHSLNRTIRRARTNTSPYPRDPHIHSGSESVNGSSSEAEDMNMYLQPTHDPAQSSYPPIYVHPSVAHIDPMQSVAMHQLQLPRQLPHTQQHQSDNALEQLASNVRSATTTSASDRAKQIFVHAWLNANYTPYGEGNVPRQGLYYSYRRICDHYGIPHMNTATLGKAIRLCFPNIKTRRLGVRGNSKYHYCGIRPSNAQEAEWLQEYIRKSHNLNQNAGGDGSAAGAGGVGQMRSHSRSSREGGAHDSHSDDDDEGGDSPDGVASATAGAGQSGTASKRSSLNLDQLKVGGGPSLGGLDDKTPTAANVLAAAQGAGPTVLSSSGFQQPAAIRRRSGVPGDPVFTVPSHQGGPLGQGPSPTHTHTAIAIAPGLGHPAAPPGAASIAGQYSIRNLPTFPKIEEALGNAGSSPQGVAAREVWRWFEDHLDALMESARTFRFDQFELHLRTFWASLNGDHREVVHAPAVAGLMAKADAILYDEILENLRSQILAPIPPQALSSLRGLADQMEKILLLALENYGSTFVEPKVELGARFGHLVLRFLDIYQVTQALATVLQNPKQMADMRRAWGQIDFESVRNQSALVCNCRHEDLVQLLEIDFVAVLERLATRSTEPVRDVIVWADECCDRLIGAGVAAARNGEDRSTLSSRSVLIRWGYVTSQIMRDLTIRSDPAFGAFQILKLFLDDWIALNVLRAVALSTNSVAASVEPVIQQQFFNLTDAVHDYTTMDTVQNTLMDHTSNVSGGLSFHTGVGMNATSSFPLGSMNYIDTSNSTLNNGSTQLSETGLITPIGSVQGGMSFTDFGGAPGSGYEVGAFGQDFVSGGMSEGTDTLLNAVGSEDSLVPKEEDVLR